MKIALHIKLASTLIASIGIAACDNCNDTDAAITKPIYLKFVDQTGKNLVNTKSGPYFTDTLKVRSGTADQIVLRKKIDSDVNDPVFELIPAFNDSGRLTTLIYLNKQDSDTLDIEYKKMVNECATVYEFEVFKYNQQNIEVNGLDNILYIKK